MNLNILDWFKSRFSRSDIKDVNPSFETFTKVRSNEDEEIIDNSVIEHIYNEDSIGAAGGQLDIITGYNGMVYGALTSDKVRRLRMYRSMVNNSEILNAVDEIADACVNRGEDENLINIKFMQHSDLIDNEEKQKYIEQEFREFIDVYDLDNNAFEFFKTLIVDGELTWENIIDNKEKDYGIIGVRQIPNESYERIVDKAGEFLGILLNAKILLGDEGLDSGTSEKMDKQGFINVQPVYGRRSTKFEVIPFSKEQITHIDSGTYNANRLVVYPVLEKARKAYNQLSLIEDSIIIHRLVRSPARYVFNVATGRLPPAKAEQLVFKMMQKYQKRKVYDSTNGTVTNDYDATSMMENFWFPKAEGDTGTTVTQLAGDSDIGDINDLKYFQKKLYLALKIPFTRFDDSKSLMENREDTISYEEYRFSKFVMKIQNRMSTGMFEAFKTHLNLKGIWQKLNLNNNDFTIFFNPPTMYDLYTKQKLIDVKMKLYAGFSQKAEFSKTLVMKEYLGWTDEQVKENEKRLDEEALTIARRGQKVDNIQQFGTTKTPEGEELKSRSNPYSATIMQHKSYRKA